MKNSTIVRRSRLVGTWIAILAFAATTSPAAATSSGCCDPQQAYPAQREYPYSSAGNPMGFQGLSSPDQYSEEGTLNQGQPQVDGEVGAGEHEVLDVQRSTAPHGETGVGWVVPGLLVFLALSVISIGLRLMFRPAERIPRIGAPGSAQ